MNHAPTRSRGPCGWSAALLAAGLLAGCAGDFTIRKADPLRVADLTLRNRAALTIAAWRGENSIFGLRPGSALVGALDAIPLRSDRTRLYSIVGNRGRGGPLETSSDGVVPYRSAHLPQARRETVVPAGHSGSLNTPATVAEVARVLRENLGDSFR